MKTNIIYTDYINRVHGCWLGKYIVDTIHARACGQELPEEVFVDPGGLGEPLPNDNLDLQVMWLEVLEQKGFHFTSGDLAEIAAEKLPYPLRGTPVCSEIWACVAPGNPAMAAALAGRGASIAEEGNAVNTAQFLAAAEALAFVEPDLDICLDAALESVPEDAALHRLVRDARTCCAAAPDWKRAREQFLRDSGSDNVPARHTGLGAFLLALHYGESNFIDTMRIAFHCGVDARCTCAAAGSILGIHHAATGLMNRYNFVDQAFALGANMKRRSDRISGLAEDVARIGITFSAFNDTIKIQGRPKPDISA